MSKLSEWSQSAPLNKNVSPDGAQDGWTGGEVGPWARETMASVASWYNDPLWVSILHDMGGQDTAKTVAVDASGDVVISSFASDPSTEFPPGRLIGVVDNIGAMHPGFVKATGTGFSASNMTVAVHWLTLSGPAAATLSDPDNFMFASTGESGGSGSHSGVAGVQLLGPAMVSGGGDAAVRDLKFPAVANLPDGIFWYNTDDSCFEVVVSGAWSRGVAHGLGYDATGADNGGPRISLSTSNWDANTLGEVSAQIYLDEDDHNLYFTTKDGSTVDPGGPYPLAYPGMSFTGGVYNEIIVKSEDIPNLTNAMIVEELHGGTTPPKMTRLLLRMTNGNNRSFPVGAEVELTGSAMQSLQASNTYYSGFAFFCDATKVYMRTQMHEWQIPDGGLGYNFTYAGRGSLITAPILAAGGSGGNDGFELVIQLWW